MSGTRSPRPSADRESPAGGGGRLPPVVTEETTDRAGATESRRPCATCTRVVQKLREHGRRRKQIKGPEGVRVNTSTIHRQSVWVRKRRHPTGQAVVDRGSHQVHFQRTRPTQNVCESRPREGPLCIERRLATEGVGHHIQCRGDPEYLEPEIPGDHLRQEGQQLLAETRGADAARRQGVSNRLVVREDTEREVAEVEKHQRPENRSKFQQIDVKGSLREGPPSRGHPSRLQQSSPAPRRRIRPQRETGKGHMKARDVVPRNGRRPEPQCVLHILREKDGSVSLCRSNQSVAPGQWLDVGAEEPVHLARKIEETHHLLRLATCDARRRQQVQGHLSNAGLTVHPTGDANDLTVATIEPLTKLSTPPGTDETWRGSG